MQNSKYKPQILEIVSQIPEGRVMYFGQIAALVGATPRVVGWIMSGLSESECENYPWQRVVAKNGYISSLKMGAKGYIQKELLLAEGHVLSAENCVDMERCLLTE